MGLPFWNNNKNERSDKMSDIFKKMHENGVEETDAFLNKSIEDYKKFYNSFNSSAENQAFSSDLNKFNNDCLKFISYIRQCFSNEEIYVLYLLRKGNILHYGMYDCGIQTDKGVIEMTSDEDLRNLYELMQNEFSSDFVDGCKHTIGEGWSLNPTIGGNVMIDINSSSPNDRNWFYEESHKEQKEDLPKKK